VVELLRRVAHRHKEYPLDETKETLPFGFLKLRYVILIFIIIYIAWVIFFFLLYGIFTGGIFGGSVDAFDNSILNL